MNTPTPGNAADDAFPLLRTSSTPNLTKILASTTDNGHRNNTETKGGGMPISFNSYRTADIPPPGDGRNLAQLAPNGLIPGLKVRRSVSADRLTMRPLSPAPPPLLRTNSDGPSLLIIQSSGALNRPDALARMAYAPPSPRVNKLADANSILNTFCGRQVYSNPYSPDYINSDSESGDDQRCEFDTPSSPLHADPFAKGREGKGSAPEYQGAFPIGALNHSDTNSSSSLLTGFKRFTKRGLQYTQLIPSTSTLPPAPSPTVSRSRSSSRSFPSTPLNHEIPPVPPLPPFALLGSRARAASSPRLAAAPLGSPMIVDQRSLLTPTPTQSLNNPLPTTPSSVSMSVSSSSASLSSAILDPTITRPRSSRNVSPQPGHSSAPEKLRQRSISESGGGSGAGSSSGNGSSSRARFANGLAQALRKTSTSSARGIEHIKPTKHRSRPKYTFAFVGSNGCGKTTLIEKGSKAANSRYKPQVTLKTVRYGDVDMTFEVREAYMLADKAHGAYPVNTIELDSKPFIKALEADAPFWPSVMPEVDGVVLCYDASAEGNARGSFDHIVRLTAAFATLHYPIIWVACKSDWIRPSKKDGQPTSPRVLPTGIVSPQQVYLLAGAEHTGLIEVTKNSHHGKEQMRNMMTWMYKAIGRARRSREDGEKNQGYHNHASPDVFDRKPNSSRPPPITVPARSALGAKSTTLPHPPSPASPPPESPASPPALLTPQRTTRARSMSDLLSQAARDQVTETSAAVLRKASATVSPMVLPRPTYESIATPTDTPKESNSRAPSSDAPKLSENTSVVVVQSKSAHVPFSFATLDELIMRLLWGNGSEADDEAFRITFALTYRRFAAPRTVLLSIIRYVRGSKGDHRARAVTTLSGYLVDWTHQYPTDFAAPGAIPPLETLIRILGESGFQKRAQELEERLPLLNTLKDDATDWAKPTVDFMEQSDSDTERDPDSRPNSSELQPSSSSPSLSVLVSTTTVVETASSPAAPQSPVLARRPSSVAPIMTELSETEEQELKRVGKLIQALNPEEVAQEIARIDHELFMSIQPRDWLRHAYTTRRDRDPAVHALDQIAHRFERLGLLIDSLILVSPKLRHRGAMFEYFLRVALSLRSYNNFAALHSIVAALDKIYYGEEGEEIESFIQNRDINWNKWLSLRVLILKSNGTAYKTALKHTTQPLIPTMAIHTSDLVRVMSNRDYKDGDPTLIHWGKFQIIAKIVHQMIELQGRLRATDNYNFPVRPDVATLLNDPKTMTEEMIVQKTFPSMNETNAGRAGTWGARVLRKVFSDR
ncbi:Ras guanine nucleotide exchange factor K [Rhizoctonia solani]|uniref:Ras guanine nucleotide exchange factor K n=1 Tax=Rhizoctonia solani TaxID=456999 RepID=A0A0K6GE05_9AGAM|nr:Ras guanine nucleotide exchange factor K [Rhizoctonia solani]